MVAYLRRKYEGEKIDLIIGLGAPALNFLSKHESDLFTGTPKIFYFHDLSEDAVRNLWPRVTGVWANLDLSKTLELALALHPNTQRVAVVSGNSVQDNFFREKAKKEFVSFESKVEFAYLTDLTIEELKTKLAALPTRSVVIYLSFQLDRAGNRYSGQEALSIFGPSSSAPIYGIAQTYMGYGIVGGSLLDFETLGRRTGEIGLRILAGDKPQNIPPETAPNVTLFDWKQLKRWGINEKQLPSGSIVQFRQPTPWEHTSNFQRLRPKSRSDPERSPSVLGALARHEREARNR